MIISKIYNSQRLNIDLCVTVCLIIWISDITGDTMAIHLVPDDDAIKEETYARMSPRYVNVYKKNNSPIFTPDHEALKIIRAYI